jgi:hypothetical protein
MTKIDFAQLAAVLIVAVALYLIGVLISFEFHPKDWWVSGRVAYLFALIYAHYKMLD